MAQPYGEEIGKIMSYFTGIFGLPPYANLTRGRNRKRRAERLCRARHDLPGAARHRQAGRMRKLLANQVSRQWWEELVSPATRNHLWLDQRPGHLLPKCSGPSTTTGPGALETQLRDVMVEALTVDNVPIIQSARLEDYSPELWALTGSKGAAVLNMLRYVIGDENFFKTLKAFCAADTPGNRSTRTISRRSRRRSPGRTWATSSSSGSNPAARRSSSWNTRFSAPRRASA